MTSFILVIRLGRCFSVNNTSQAINNDTINNGQPVVGQRFETGTSQENSAKFIDYFVLLIFIL